MLDSYSSLVELGLKTYSSRPESEEDNMLFPLATEEKKRQRYKKHKNYYPEIGPRWGLFFSVYLDSLPDILSKQLLLILIELSVFKFTSDSALRKFLTEVTTFSKKHLASAQSPFPDKVECRYLINLENGGGYALITESKIEDSVRTWVSKKEFPLWYEDLFDDAIEELFHRGFLLDNPVEEKDLPDIDQFLIERSWSTPGGSSDTHHLHVNIDGKSHKMQKTKMTTAVTVSDDDIIALAYSEIKQSNKVVEKREQTKVRAAISSDLPTYLKMVVCNNFISTIFKNSPSSLLFMSSNDQVSKWIEWCKIVGVNFPFDQSGFDQHVAKWMILKWISKFQSLLDLKCKSMTHYAGYKEMFRLLYYALDGGTIRYEKTGLTIVVEGGLMSGWYLTALLDTIINMTQFMCWVLFVERVEHDNVPLNDSSFFGDDIRLVFTHEKWCVSFYNFMENLRYGVNPKKIFISKYNNEFLRKITNTKGIFAYPARAINSVLWRNPVNPEPPKNPTRAFEIMTNWAVVLSRSGNRRNVERMMLKDISGALNIKSFDVARLLITPKTFGGLGWDIASNYLDLNKTGYLNILFKNKTLSWCGFDTKQKNIVYTYQEPLVGLSYTNRFWGLDLKPKPTSLGNWEGYNFKDIDFTLADKTIPTKYNNTIRPRAERYLGAKPRFIKDIPPFFRTEYLLLKVNDIKTAADAVIFSQKYLINYDFAKDILTRSNLKLWRMWITETLPISKGFIPEVDPLFYSGLFDSQISSAFTSLLVKQKFGLADVEALSYALEFTQQKSGRAYLPDINLSR